MDRKHESGRCHFLRLSAPAWTTRFGCLVIEPQRAGRLKVIVSVLAVVQAHRLKMRARWSHDRGESWILSPDILVDSPSFTTQLFEGIDPRFWCADIELVAGATPAECEVGARDLSSER